MDHRLAEPLGAAEPTREGNPVGTVDSYIATSTGSEVAQQNLSEGEALHPPAQAQELHLFSVVRICKTQPIFSINWRSMSSNLTRSPVEDERLLALMISEPQGGSAD